MMRSLSAIVVFSLVVFGATLWLHRSSEAATGGIAEAKVRLYSDGKVVGEWLAVGAGRVEGNTFVFPVRQGVRELEVRVSGTFSFEQQP